MKNSWIKSPVDLGAASASFVTEFSPESEVKSAQLLVSAIGIFQASLNGEKLGKGVLNPGFTSYNNRVQFMTYDVTSLLKAQNNISITAGNGWAVGHMGLDTSEKVFSDHYAITAKLQVVYADGSEQQIVTDENWKVYSSPIEYSDIYHGETVNLMHQVKLLGNAVKDEASYKFNLVAQIGPDIVENERLAPIQLIVTPKGERVIDFGQNMAGYVEFKIKGKAGEKIVISHAEVLDADGNFYNENYRGAKNCITYILDGNDNCFKPTFSFQGFRYIRLDEYPDVEVDLNNIRAIAVHSQMARIGRFSCGNEKINQLYHNTIWGQKSNYLDIPTDCPQRDERLGWTGDAQAFCRTAALNYDVRKFFEKWLGDLRAEQREDGGVYGTCPECFSSQNHTLVSAAWGDVVTIAPWELYRAYGDAKVLNDNFSMMKKWVDYMHSAGDEEFLWLGGAHYGDWLAMDAGEDNYSGATSADFIASAFFAHSTDLVIRAGEVLGENVDHYRQLHKNVLKSFREYFMEPGVLLENPDESAKGYITQTCLVLILYFNLCKEEERPLLQQKLVKLIGDFGDRMVTGFVGTPYILHVLSDAGNLKLAYKLLLSEKTPSWLYSVTHGATTMWEHWNSIKEDGSFWSVNMNSFNHYAYGSVCDWLYGVAAGITTTEEGAGYRKFTLAPKPCRELKHINCALDTVNGRIESRWYYKNDEIYFEFTVPSGAQAIITLPNGYTETVGGGVYHYTVKE
ncbi:MAG: family 78 glycoside hydrolase catalytic domain [Clostridia bacterium]|nr:family 78 glycoside hydrolase catalytic domain [Clostridia bacterium]